MSQERGTGTDAAPAGEQPSIENVCREYALADRLSDFDASACDYAHDQLLDALCMSDLRFAINAFTAGLFEAWMETCSTGLVDAVFAPGLGCGRDLSFDIAPIDADALTASSALEWIKVYTHLHEAGVTAWVLWYDDGAQAPTPVVVAADNNGRAAAWTVDVRHGHWWPIWSRDCGLTQLFAVRGREDAPERSHRHVLVRACYGLAERITQLQGRLRDYEAVPKAPAAPSQGVCGYPFPAQGRHVPVGDPT
jgi:hypothetical protein